MNYEPQIGRIRSKLEIAKDTDTSFKVFGAGSHRYFIKPPVPTIKVIAFESEYGISLPECYRSFVTQIGSGGISYFDSGAGPFFGIYPFGENVDQLVEAPKIYLRENAKIYSGLTDSEWSNLMSRIEEEEDIPDEEYHKEIGEIYSGILPIGHQGCAYIHAIILNGESRGKVVNLDITGNKPIFTYENNFLDWYERWLDEIISGELISIKPTWFGYAPKKEE